MANRKNTSKSAKPISDVEKPGKSAASATSKAVLVTNRPIIKDPMVVEENQKENETPEVPVKKTSTKPKIQPLESSPSMSEPEKTDIEPEKKEDDAPVTPEDAPVTKPAKKKESENDEELEAKRKAEHDVNLQKIVDAKTYYLPINAVEKRRTKRFVILGVLFSILLMMVWFNIVLDAELMQIDGINPVTSFF